MTNKYNTTLYVGVTSDLLNRVIQHKNGVYPGSFSSRYNLDKLVYFNYFETIVEAIAEEKRLKGGPRNQKIKLIGQMNPEWKDLFDLL